MPPGFVAVEAPHDFSRGAVPERRRNSEHTAGHLGALAQIADAGAAKPCGVMRLIGHADAVIAYFEAEQRACALEVNPRVFGLGVFRHIVEQFLHAAKYVRRNSLGYFVVFRNDIGVNGRRRVDLGEIPAEPAGCRRGTVPTPQTFWLSAQAGSFTRKNAHDGDQQINARLGMFDD